MIWYSDHTLDGMKMTMHIDEALLARAMAFTGAASKTAAVDLALRELVRRGELVELAKAGLGLSAAELKEVFDPAYDLAGARSLGEPVNYGRKSRAGR
jgi:Arc/MetJ family transcription regulator